MDMVNYKRKHGVSFGKVAGEVYVAVSVPENKIGDDAEEELAEG